MLFNAGLIDRLGKVENGNTTTDYDPEEIARGISINVALAPLEWKNTKINVIDAPGFFDFYGEVTAAMMLADSALIVVSAVSGPVVGAEKAMSMCEKAHKARMIARRERPCLMYHIGKCCAPCSGNVTREEYHKLIDEVISFLSGNTTDILRSLNQQMNTAAESMDFELV